MDVIFDMAAQHYRATSHDKGQVLQRHANFDTCNAKPALLSKTRFPLLTKRVSRIAEIPLVSPAAKAAGSCFVQLHYFNQLTLCTVDAQVRGHDCLCYSCATHASDTSFRSAQYVHPYRHHRAHDRSRCRCICTELYR